MSWGPGWIPAPHKGRQRKSCHFIGPFQTWITSEQTGPESHSPYSPLSWCSAPASDDLFLKLPPPTSTSPLTPTRPFLFSTHAFLFFFPIVLSLCDSGALLRPWMAVEAGGAVSKCLLMCRLHMMLDLVVRGHNLLVFRCGRREAHILIRAGGSRSVFQSNKANRSSGCCLIHQAHLKTAAAKHAVLSLTGKKAVGGRKPGHRRTCCKSVLTSQECEGVCG